MPDGWYRNDGGCSGCGACTTTYLSVSANGYVSKSQVLGRGYSEVQRLDLPLDRGAFEGEIARLLGEFGDGDAQLRLVATRGGRRIAFTENLPPYAAAERIRVATVEYSPSVLLTGVKSLSYAANMKAIRLADSRGADDAVLVRPDGVVLEAPTSTIFWATGDGRLRTPSLDVGILASITRDRLLGELDVEEGSFQLDDLLGATEAFLASTVREVQSISAVDETELPECPGRWTKQAAEAFTAILDRELAASASS